MRKPLLIVIAGPNGSGKTTITSRVIRHQWAESCEYINLDWALPIYNNTTKP